ncbi:hypothetical protein [Cytobacillus firmus]|uniref:Uncharacterized protein n=1 Tax=Cytobacillus firmus DS1 TaxID=1307436 RepID=W7LA17_CYTFI|nr:hypothetical protein [Cytobacillus firmus]EWG12061.1 hypothetical protein PBF_04678 [Cytobacillus firmus DS1]
MAPPAKFETQSIYLKKVCSIKTGSIRRGNALFAELTSLFARWAMLFAGSPGLFARQVILFAGSTSLFAKYASLFADFPFL